MADSPAARPASSSGKILGLRPRTALIVAGVAVAGGVVFFWWRNRSNAGSATATPATGNCTDSTGATVPCPEEGAAVDQSGELSAIQTELETLLGEQAGTTGSTTTTGTGTKTGTKPVTPPSKPAPASPPPEPAGVRITGVTPTGFTVSWTRAAGATSYGWRVTYQSKLVGSGTVTGTSAKVSGLTPDHTYTVHIRSIGPGGQSAETNGPAAKTPKG